MQKKNTLEFINYKKIFLFLAVMVLFGCKIKQTKKPTEHEHQFFNISFYSPGNGIDRDAKIAVDATIQSYTKKGFEIKYTAIPWGREGEVDYCFALQKMDPEVYNAFLKELKNLLKNKMVHLEEKRACRTEM